MMAVKLEKPDCGPDNCGEKYLEVFCTFGRIFCP